MSELGVSTLFFSSLWKFYGLIGCYILVLYAYATIQKIPLGFAYLFRGFLLLILLTSSIQALIQTEFKSILALYLPWTLVFFLVGRKKKFLQGTRPSLPWQTILLLSGVVFLWSFLSLVNFTSVGVYLPSGLETQANDFFIYAQRSQYIGETGEENVFGLLNNLSGQYQGVSPYHYLELWLGNAFARLFDIPHVLSLGLLVKPIFYFTSALGLASLMSLIAPSKKFSKGLLVLGLFFMSGLYLSLPFLNLPQFNLSMLTYRYKMIVYYPFMIAFVLELYNGRTDWSILWLCALMIATVVVIPAFLGAGVCFWLWKEFHGNHELRSSLILLILTAISIGAFYLFLSNPSIGSSLGLQQQELGAFISWEYIVGVFSTFLGAILTLMLVYTSTLILTYLWYRKTKYKQQNLLGLFQAFAGIIFFGAATYALLHPFENANQLFFNLGIVSLNLGTILLILHFLEAKEYPRLIWILFLLSIGNQLFILSPKLFGHHVAQSYSASYINTIHDLIKGHELSGLGGVIKAEQDYHSDFSKIAFAYTGAYYLQYLDENIACVSLSEHVIPINPKNQRNNLVNRNSGYFYQYVQASKNKGTFISIAESQKRFIETQDINFLVLSKHAKLSSELENMVKEKITDSLSGEQFFLLHKP